MSHHSQPGYPAGTGPHLADCPPDVLALLIQMAKHLAEGHVGQALAIAEHANIRSPWVDNARGVCHMRLGRTSKAVDILRGLVFDPSGFGIRHDVHPVHQANYATALLLNGNSDGFFGMLSGIADRKHPAVARLDDAIRRWKAGMTWGQWLKSFLGSPAKPFTLDFPPGDLGLAS